MNTALILLISSLIPVVNNLLGFIFKAKATLAQSAEKTPEEEAALDAEIAKLKLNPEEWEKEQPL